MSTFIATNITAANGIVITPSVLKFANGAVLNVGNSSIEQGNGQPIVNTDASFTFGTASINSTLIIVPAIIGGGGSFFGGTLGGIVNTQLFTANGTWTNPNNALGLSGNEQVFVMLWGGGGGANTGRGGSGGACIVGTYFISEIGNTATITVGTGGTVGLIGNNSIFAPTGTAQTITGYAGAPATATLNGGGGGWLSAGTPSNGGEPLGGSATVAGTFGGGGSIAPSIFGGGGGSLTTSPGASIFGGAGGVNTGVIATSIFGGSGGNASVSATTPGGGGGGVGSGARGEVRVWVIR